MSEAKEALDFLLDNLSLTLEVAKYYLRNNVSFCTSFLKYDNVKLMYRDNDDYKGGFENNKGRGYYIIYKGKDGEMHEDKIVK